MLDLEINNLRYVVEVVDDSMYYKGEYKVRYKVLIAIKNKTNGISLPVQLATNFLNEEYIGKSTKTMENAAYYLVKFMNYILIESKYTYKLKNLLYIEFGHAEDFLNYYGLEVSRSSVRQCEMVLTKFYFYIAEKRLSEKFDATQFMIRDAKVISPLKKIDYPPPNTLNNKLHNFPKELVILFIEFAFKEFDDIALGLYMQIFGGLRIGDVINLTYDDISLYMNDANLGMVLRIQENNLRPELKRSGAREGIKKERYQVVLGHENLLGKLYSEHRKNQIIRNEKNTVFLNRNGQPMTKSSYRRKFNILKEEFIKKIGQMDDVNMKSYSLVLLSKKWSTHVGRGIFSNMIAEVSNNILQVALYRGDSNLNSALTYLASMQGVRNKLHDNIDQFYSNPIFNDREELK